MTSCPWCGNTVGHEPLCLAAVTVRPPRPSGQELREKGLDRVERHGWVGRMRDEAERLDSARPGGVHVDDLRDFAEHTDDPAPSKHAWGAIFRRTDSHPWRMIGVRPSRHASNHAHASPVWTMRAP